MIFLADESLDRQIVDVLRRDDHVVLYVAEMDPGISDDAVLNKANSFRLRSRIIQSHKGSAVFLA